MTTLARDREVLGRLCDRLRSMSDTSLTRSREGLDGRSVAAAVHDLCSWAVHQQGMTAPVPVLHPLQAGTSWP